VTFLVVVVGGERFVGLCLVESRHRALADVAAAAELHRDDIGELP